MSDFVNWREDSREDLERKIAKCREDGGRELHLIGQPDGYGQFEGDAEAFDECLDVILQRLPGLQQLTLGFSHWQNAAFALFCRRAAEFPNLQTLELDSVCGDDALRMLARHSGILPLIRSITLADISDDGLKLLADQAEHLSGLTMLDFHAGGFGDEGLRALADQAENLLNLEVITDVTGEAPEVSPTGAEALLSFTRLTSLELETWPIGDAWISKLAKCAKQFTRLRALILFGTQVGDDGVKALAKYAHDFRKLERLNLDCTEVGSDGLKALAKCGKQLARLRWLDLSGTHVGDEGVKALADNARHFGKLELLSFDDTNVSDEGLKALALAWQRGDFHHLQELDLMDIESNVAPEVLDTRDATQIFEAVLDGLALPEAKLVVLGEPGVGKTSLCRRLFLDEPVDPSWRKETHDFELIIPEWRPAVKGQDVQLRVWDFGGQHVLHGTHEMFLTSRSVCLLVLDATQVAEHDPEVQDDERDGNRLSYWLKMIQYSVGGDAHVILVVTKCDETEPQLGSLDADRLRIDHHFTAPMQIVESFSATEKERTRPINDLQEKIKDALGRMDELGQKVSWKFVALKEEVESRMEGRAFVALEEFRQWCREFDITKQSDQDASLRTLRHFGSVFYFGLLDCDRKTLEERRSRKRSRLSDDLPWGQRRLLEAERDSALRHWVINPRWLKRPLYRLIRQSAGQQWLSADEIRDEAQQETPQVLLDDPDAAGDIFLAVLKLTELCFDDRGKYFFPRGLPRDGSRFLTGWDESNRHEAVWQWEFFPETVIHRLIVRAHERGEVLSRAHWRTGLVLQHGETTAAIQSEPERGRVTVWLKKREDNAKRPTRGDERFLQRIHDQLCVLVVREPKEKSCSWEDGEANAADGDRPANTLRLREDINKGPVERSADARYSRRSRRRAGRPKKSEKDSATFVVAALSKHHGYESGGSVRNYEPATNRGLARECGLSENALSRFLKDKLGADGAKQYKIKCRQGTIGSLLVIWNRELPKWEPEPPSDDAGRE